LIVGIPIEFPGKSIDCRDFIRVHGKSQQTMGFHSFIKLKIMILNNISEQYIYMGLVNIAVDVTMSATWWVLCKTVGGVYNGISYLIYGNSEKEKDIRLLLEEQNNKIAQLTSTITELKNNKINNKIDFVQ
jgi:hypothetical protein